nr:MAG TPA: hypothetical protein [Caudoviricetes sp.]
MEKNSRLVSARQNNFTTKTDRWGLVSGHELIEICF